MSTDRTNARKPTSPREATSCSALPSPRPFSADGVSAGESWNGWTSTAGIRGISPTPDHVREPLRPRGERRVPAKPVRQDTGVALHHDFSGVRVREATGARAARASARAGGEQLQFAPGRRHLDSLVARPHRAARQERFTPPFDEVTQLEDGPQEAQRQDLEDAWLVRGLFGGSKPPGQVRGVESDIVDRTRMPAPPRAEPEQLSGPVAHVAQRTPADWQVSPDINRILGHAHGWFSTWKKIKARIREYQVLDPLYLVVRRSKLEVIEDLIGEWEANAKHTAASTEQRVIDIRADMPVLKNLVLVEQHEIEDALLLHYATHHGALPAGIPDELTAGIAGLPGNAAKAARLFQNVNNFRFRYTGDMIGGAAAMHARQGDCESLAGIFGHVAAAMGIPFAYGQSNEALLVAPQPIHGRNDLGNTEGATHWFFGGGHTWVTSGGVNYDLLFMTSPSPASVAADRRSAHNGVSYYHFPDGRCVIEPGNEALDVAIGGQGRVFATELATTAFIDENTD